MEFLDEGREIIKIINNQKKKKTLSLIWCHERVLHLSSSLPQDLQSESDDEKKQAKWNSESLFYKNTWPGLLKSVEVMKNKEKWRTYNYKSEETKETWWLNEMWYPALDPGTEKGKISGKTNDIWIKTVVLNQC